MNIALPDRFFYDAGNNNIAYVENGILYIEGRVNFDDLMYTITYSLKGYEKCFYCGNDLTHRRRTIDHMYPRFFGGISIPNNMVPCCSSCNSTKSCLTAEQYINLRTIKSKDQKDVVFKFLVEQNQSDYESGFILPSEWITDYTLGPLIDEIDFSAIKRAHAANRRIQEFFSKYHRYPCPIVVSSNDWIFKGLHILYHARKNSIASVPAVVMDNVVHISQS